MVSLYFWVVKLSIVIGIQATVLKPDLLPVGSRCSFNSDCYTGKCSLTIDKSFKSCISKTQNPPNRQKASSIRKPDPTYCILTDHYCTSNDDCCSKVCKHIAFSKLNYCQTQGNDLPFNNSYGLATSKPTCLSNGENCFDNGQCCSGKCSYYFGSYKNICVPQV